MNLELQLIVVACFWTWLLFIEIDFFLNVDLCRHDIPSVEQHVLLKKAFKNTSWNVPGLRITNLKLCIPKMTHRNKKVMHISSVKYKMG